MLVRVVFGCDTTRGSSSVKFGKRGKVNWGGARSKTAQGGPNRGPSGRGKAIYLVEFGDLSLSQY